MTTQNHTRNTGDEPPAVGRVRAFNEHFGPDALRDLPMIYATDVVFQDPVHRIEGVPALQAYFERVCQNVVACAFDIKAIHVQSDNQAWLEWEMRYSHPRLRGGSEIALDGVSHMRFQERISYHRDYFDLGSMLYEHVPVVGGAVRWLKRRMES